MREAEKLEGRMIVIVEPNDLMRNGIRGLFLAKGVSAVAVVSSRQAMPELIECDARVLIVALSTEEFGDDRDGLLRFIHSVRETNPGIRIVGTSMIFDEQSAGNLGLDLFVPKDLITEHLDEIIALAGG